MDYPQLSDEEPCSDNEATNYTLHHRRADIIRSMPHQPRCAVCYVQPYKMSRFCNLYALLPNCIHSVCLGCMRMWRHQRISTGAVPCPVCRTPSIFYYASRFWPCQADKETLISYYKMKLSKIHCRSYQRGWKKCRYNSDCPYKHQLPNGVIVQPKLHKPPLEHRACLHLHVRNNRELRVYVYNADGIREEIYMFSRPRTRSRSVFSEYCLSAFEMYIYTEE